MMEMDEIEFKEGMSVEERIKVLVRQYDIRLGQDFCVNDPVDYNQTKGIIRGLNLALDQIENASE